MGKLTQNNRDITNTEQTDMVTYEPPTSTTNTKRSYADSSITATANDSYHPSPNKGHRIHSEEDPTEETAIQAYDDDYMNDNDPLPEYEHQGVYDDDPRCQEL